MSGGYEGATGSVSVDINKFKAKDDTKKEFEEEENINKVGDEKQYEPIQMKLMSIEKTLDLKFWGNLDELQANENLPCSKMTKKTLKEIQKQMKRALKDYPKLKGVHKGRGRCHISSKT